MYRGARLIYSGVLYLLVPFVLLRLLFRALKAPAYLRRWRERFGIYPNFGRKHVIWLHAVSVGEVEAAFPLIRRLRRQISQMPILITTTTPTGSARVRGEFGDQVQHVYLPYDLPGAVARFFRNFEPRLGLIMETEIWPNLYYQCAQRKTPLLIVNARLSSNSARGYGKLRFLVRQTLKNVSVIAVQTESDAHRFREIGANPETVIVAGNIKFDLCLSEQLRRRAADVKRDCFGERPVWIAASTHSGEDEQILEAFAELKKTIDLLLLVLVPRHPERFNTVAKLCRAQGFSVHRRTEPQPYRRDIDIFLLDTLGELRLFYLASDLAFVGGSLVNCGGHNVLEPAAAGVPVIFGPCMDNFSDIAGRLLNAGAAIQVDDQQALTRCVLRLIMNPETAISIGGKGQVCVAENRGALERICAIIADRLVEQSTSNG